MKATETRTAATPARNNNPFFQKESSQSFFSGHSIDTPFFTKKENTQPVIQPKLTIGEPNDKYEQEADTMADKVVQRLATPDVQTKGETTIQAKPVATHITPLVQTKCAECEQEDKLQKKEHEEANGGLLNGKIQKKPVFESEDATPDDENVLKKKCSAYEGNEEKKVQSKSENGPATTANLSIESNLSSSKGPGSILPKQIRSQMESSFGADFSGVRIHNDSSAGQMNKELHAHAFTHGSDIYFNHGKYDTNSNFGKHLLAHELTHVVQQSGCDIQRFGESEHYKLGHQGTKDDKGNERMVKLAADFTLSYGEMVAMGGDHFSSIDQMRSFANNSNKTGKESREELEYVRIVEIRGEKHRKNEFSEEARKNADERYYELATKNKSHFPNPNIGDKVLPASVKAEQWINNMKQIPNAYAGYRMYHVQAILEAYMDGSVNKEIDFALATDAFGAHFLTDMFAGGHVMTPRAGILEHWNGIVPLFYNNLKGYMAEEISEKLEKSMYWGVLTEEAVYKGMLGQEGAYETVSKMLDTYPKLTFGDIVSGSIHDYYNKKGIKAKAGGREVKLFGDGHLGEGDEWDLAVQAVRLSYEDIQAAYRMGKSQSNMLDLFSLIKDGLFAAEKLIPEAMKEADMQADEKPIKWDYFDYLSLLSDPKFQEALKVFAISKASEMEGIAKKLNHAKKEKAFNEAITTPMAEKPEVIVKEIIEWTPDTGGGVFGHNEDDNALDYTTQIKKEGALDKLVTPQRIRLIRQLAGGVWAAGDEEEMIVRIFETAPASERPKMYQAIEGHKWNGDFIEGFWVDDDDLWNAIDDDGRLKRLRASINE
jgi:hypothetical protein